MTRLELFSFKIPLQMDNLNSSNATTRNFKLVATHLTPQTPESCRYPKSSSGLTMVRTSSGLTMVRTVLCFKDYVIVVIEYKFATIPN